MIQDSTRPALGEKTSARKIAWLSPFPPQKSGIANYSCRLVRALQPYLDIDLYVDPDDLVSDLNKEFKVRPMTDFAETHREYDEAVFHVGNNSLFHKRIYQLAWHFPGTLVLHDYDLRAFFSHGFSHLTDRQFYKRVMLEERGEQSDTRAAGGGNNLPMSKAIVARSKKVVVHHRWLKRQFPQNTHIEVIPHFARLNYRPSTTDEESFRARFGIKPNLFVVSCLGFINGNKLPELQIKVVKRLLSDGYPVTLLFAGEPAPEIRSLVKATRSAPESQNIIFTGYLSEEDYFTAISVSDIVLAFRNPSMGEASGTLMHALAAGKPTIVSDTNQYKEFPDKVCWKLAHDDDEAEVLYEYLKTLLGERRLRQMISAQASEYVNTVFAWDGIIARWVELLSS